MLPACAYVPLPDQHLDIALPGGEQRPSTRALSRIAERYWAWVVSPDVVVMSRASSRSVVPSLPLQHLVVEFFLQASR